MKVIRLDPIDVKCGDCGGQLSLGPEGEHVVCPHCGATLLAPENRSPGETLLAVPSAEAGSSIHDPAAGGLSNLVVPSSIKGPDFRQWGAAHENSDSSSNSSVAIAPVEEPSPAPASFPSPIAEEKSTETPAAATAPQTPAPQSRPAPWETRSPHRAATKKGEDDGGSGVSRTAFLGLVIYASVMTALCLGLAFLVATSRERQLESLPDVVPKMNEDGEIARTLVPIDAELPPGHRLELGESQRFGDLLVTPLRVTREPLTFTHYRGEGTREPAGEVLKLWVRFENVGDDGKSFTPLDRELLFYRIPGLGPLEANNFLAAADGSGAEEIIPIYDHPTESDWDLTGQELGTVLAPGESWKTFAPSATEIPDLEGEWVWRLHLRKGVASNGWGVTTLVEVEFNADDVT